MSRPAVLIAEELSPATVHELGPDFDARAAEVLDGREVTGAKNGYFSHRSNSSRAIATKRTRSPGWTPRARRRYWNTG